MRFSLVENFYFRLKEAPRVTRRDIFLVLLPAIAWLIAFRSRSLLIELKCTTLPQTCTSESVFYPDRVALGYEIGRADELSFLTQDIAAYAAISIPILFAIYSFFRGNEHKALKLWISQGLTDLLILGQTILWNGLATETARVLVQRPRPFVYKDPAELGKMPAHYTSFYSGHTSFAASAGFAMILILMGRKAPTPLLALLSIGVAINVVLTGLFRVLAGRHFPTDVTFAAIAGTTVAVAIAWIHRPGGIL